MTAAIPIHCKCSDIVCCTFAGVIITGSSMTMNEADGSEGVHRSGINGKKTEKSTIDNR
jgi:hypothetical protein